MNKVDARYISFNSPEDVLKEQERLMSLPIEEMILEMKRLCLDYNDWKYFTDELTSDHQGYGRKSNVIFSGEEYLAHEISSSKYTRQMPLHQNFQIRKNWAQIRAMLCMRETFSMCATELADATDMEKLAINYNRHMGRYIDDRQREECIKEFSIDKAFAELRDMVSTIERFYETEEGEILPETQTMGLLEQCKTQLTEILTGAKSIGEKYTDEYSEIYGEIEYLLSELCMSDEQEMSIFRSQFFEKIDIVRDPEKEKREPRVSQEEPQATQTSQSTVDTQDIDKSRKAQKLAEFMKTQGLTQSDILELLTTLGRDGMRIEAEQQVVNMAESERTGKTNENEGVNR